VVVVLLLLVALAAAVAVVVHRNGYGTLPPPRSHAEDEPPTPSWRRIA